MAGRGRLICPEVISLRPGCCHEDGAVVDSSPCAIKARLDAFRHTGTTASGFSGHLLKQHFGQDVADAKKGQ